MLYMYRWKVFSRATDALLKVVILLTLSPKAEKRRPHIGIGLRRLRAAMIVAGIYACRRILSLVPEFQCESGEGPLEHIPPSLR